MQERSKLKLSVPEQIEHLKTKGVLFTIMNESTAADYLRNNNYYFKLVAYRKNYQKHSDGKYKSLEFAYLVDMAIIDMKLRYCVIHMALDIEHHIKLQLLRMITENPTEDGYRIVRDYEENLKDLKPDQHKRFLSELSRGKDSIYCKDVTEKYDGIWPVWTLLEVIPFGRLVDFYKFCGERWNNRAMWDNHYRLRMCKDIRNAAAHSNCILNDLTPKTAQHKTNYVVAQELMEIQDMTEGFRDGRMNNARIQALVTLLYTHKTMVISQGLHKQESNELHKLVERFDKYSEYYKSNKRIRSVFNFLKSVIDGWF